MKTVQLHATIWILKTMLNAKHKRAHTMTVYITQKQAKLTHCIGKWDNTQPGEEGG